MNQVNPAVIPRNHRVEEALAACELRDDIDVLHRLLEALQRPFDDSAEQDFYRNPPPSDQTCYQTFCGT